VICGDAIADGMSLSVRLRLAVTVTDADRLLATARRFGGHQVRGSAAWASRTTS
jgi:hypothetical protein